MNQFPCINLHSHQLSKDSEWTIYNLILPAALSGHVIPDTYYSAGIHPWYIPDSCSDTFAKLRELAQSDRLIAIGECGLDRSIETPINRQMDVFLEHIDLSEAYEKPLIIHAVRTLSDIAGLRKKLKPKQAWILHDYRPKQEQTQQLLKLGFYFSIGPTFFLNRDRLFSEMLPPLSKIFFETDDYDLPVINVYRHFAELVKVEESELIELVYKNFVKLFNTSDKRNGMVK